MIVGVKKSLHYSEEDAQKLANNYKFYKEKKQEYLEG